MSKNDKAKKIKLPNAEKLEISGALISSTIAQMASLGSIGETVLKKYGITEVDLKTRYSNKVRIALWDEVYKRYGSHALFVMGFDVTAIQKEGGYALGKEEIGILNSIGIIREDIDFFSSLHFGISSNSIDNFPDYFSLERVLKFDTAIVGITLARVYGLRLGVEIPLPRAQMLEKGKYELSYVAAHGLRHEAFFRGNRTNNYIQKFGEYWKFDIELDFEKSHEENGWAHLFYKMTFERNRSSLNFSEMLTEKKHQIRDELMKLVLNEAELEKKKSDVLSEQLSKYIPPQIHGALMEGKYDTEITTRRKKLTIFFSDIKNFTSTSEGLQPEDLTKYLNEYFSEMTAIALDCGATIDKYIGDAMMVFFGDPESNGEQKDARSCVEMALRMQERMLELQEKWRNEGFADPFQVRMGMNTGYCNVGNFGSEQRLTYTIIGGEVNVAQRLEVNADTGGILLSYETYAHAQDMIEVEEKDAIAMKGINREIKVFSVKGRRLIGDKQTCIEKQTLGLRDANAKSVGAELSVVKRLNNLELSVTNLANLVNKLVDKLDV